MGAAPQGGVTGTPQGGAAGPPQGRASAPRRSTTLEIGTLYAASIGYGIGLGVWIDAEAGIADPGVRFIPPSVLGLAAPVGVYFLDQPSMPRGLPAATAAGMAIGAGEGLGIASYQYVTAKASDAWGFRGLSRSVVIGSTAGAVGGYAIGYYEEPSPKLSAFVSSGVLWGTVVGSMFGYGASAAGVGYGRSNDSASLGGLIGFNVGLAATAGLSTLFVPSWHELGWMWIGGGIGAAVSLPVFLFYAGDNTPPAKRGLVFMGTATTLGILAGGIFSAGTPDADSRSVLDLPRLGGRFASVTSVVPIALPEGAGIAVGGVLE